MRMREMNPIIRPFLSPNRLLFQSHGNPHHIRPSFSNPFVHYHTKNNINNNINISRYLFSTWSSSPVTSIPPVQPPQTAYHDSVQPLTPLPPPKSQIKRFLRFSGLTLGSLILIPTLTTLLYEYWPGSTTPLYSEVFLSENNDPNHPLLLGVSHNHLTRLTSGLDIPPPAFLVTTAETFIGLWRAIRTAYTGGRIMFDYWWGFHEKNPNKLYSPWQIELAKMNGTNTLSDEEEAANKFRLESLHLTNAERLISLIQWARGPYIKMGQMIAASNSGGLPQAYSNGCRIFQHAAPTRPYSHVQAIFLDQFELLPSEMFLYFDPKPIAAASLAQVHLATMLNGQRVVVKVQHHGIDKQWSGDISAMMVLLVVAEKLFPNLEFKELFIHFAENTSSELNFQTEAKNSIKTSYHFADNKQIYVPEIHMEMSSKKILTMEFIDNATFINEPIELSKRGFNLNEVTSLLMDCFAQQIFVHGFVHADCHPGNILVRPLSALQPHTPQIVLLDHGLYRQLGGPFRRQFSRIVHDLITLNHQGVEDELNCMGIFGLAPLFKGLITMTSGRDSLSDNLSFKSDQNLTFDQEAMENAKEVWSHITYEDMKNMMNRLPADLFLVLRTLTLLRSLQLDLETDINRFLIFAHSAARGAWIKYENEPKRGFTPGITGKSYLDINPLRLVSISKTPDSVQEPTVNNFRKANYEYYKFYFWVIFYRLYSIFFGFPTISAPKIQKIVKNEEPVDNKALD